MRKSKGVNTRRTKREAPPHAKQFPPDKRLRIEQDTNDRLAACGRGDSNELIHIGEVVEMQITGEFGAILRALLKGMAAGDLAESRVRGGMSPDRYLGRLDAYEKISQNLEQYVIDKDNAIKKLAEEAKQNTEEDLQTAPDVMGERV